LKGENNMDIEELKQRRAKTLDLLKRNLSLYDLARRCIEASEKSGDGDQMLRAIDNLDETMRQTAELMKIYCEESAVLMLISN
jgi:hypothetical protein